MKNDTKITLLRTIAMIFAIIGIAFLVGSMFAEGTRLLTAGLACNCIGMICNLRGCKLLKDKET